MHESRKRAASAAGRMRNRMRPAARTAPWGSDPFPATGAVAQRSLAAIVFLLVAALYLGALTPIALTDPDEVFYSQTAREMIDQHTLLTPVLFGHPQFEKPPLLYWCLIGSFRIFGMSPFAARLVPVSFGAFGIIATFLFCRRLFGEKAAGISAVLLGTSGLYLVMSDIVLTDIALTALMAAALYCFYLWFLERADSHLYGFATAAALAVLTKGPVALVIVVSTAVIFLALQKDLAAIRRFLVHPWVLLFAALSMPWYAYAWAKYGRAFIDEFIVRDNWDRILYAEHPRNDHWWFYPAILFFGLFPWTSYLVLIGRRWKEFRSAHVFFAVWFAVTFLVFQIAHSKLPSYVLPAFPALIIPAGLALSSWEGRSRRGTALSFVHGFFGVALCVLPSFPRLTEYGPYVWHAAVFALRLMGVLVIVASVALWRGKVLQAVAVEAAGVVLLALLIALSIPESVDRATTSRYVADIVAREGYEGQPVVTTKQLARGIHFYTGNPVVVLHPVKQPWWSPHPVEVLTTNEEITRYFASRSRVICVLQRSSIEELQRLFNGKRLSRVVARDGGKIVLVSEKIAMPGAQQE